MYVVVIVLGVYKLKECHLVDILDDEIRGTLRSFTTVCLMRSLTFKKREKRDISQGSNLNLKASVSLHHLLLFLCCLRDDVM